MIRSGNSTSSGDAERRQNGSPRPQKPGAPKPRSLEPGVVILAEIGFAALLLYMANQPLEITDLAIAENTTDRQEIVADREIATTKPTIELVTELAAQNATTAADFKTAAGVAVAATDINATDALISN